LALIEPRRPFLITSAILSLDEVYNLIKNECEKQNEIYLLELITKRYKSVKKNEDEAYQFNMFFTLFRATLVTDLVKHVTKVFIQNHQEIFDGSFNYALLDFDKQSKYYGAIKIIEKISRKYIYQNKDVETLDLKGYAIINGLFDIYKPILELSCDDFSKLLNEEKIDCFISMRLIRRISSKQIVAYKDDVKNLDESNIEQYNMLQWYYRARLVIDYISGMTDDFAFEEYNILSAIK